MGPLAFALGLESILDQCLIPQSTLAWSSWYLDDLIIAGSLKAVRNYSKPCTIRPLRLA